MRAVVVCGVCAVLAFVAGGCRKTSSVREDAAVAFTGMVVDVVEDGAPRFTGTGDVAEIRGAATTPWKRAAMGADAARMRGAKTLAFVAGDRRTKPIDLPRAETGGMAIEHESVSIDQSGVLALNGANVASPAELGRILAARPSRKVFLAPHVSIGLGKVIDVAREIERLDRPMAFTVAM
jgi:hypothetical protein